MNVRTRKPAASSESANASASEVLSAKQAAVISPTYGTTDVRRFQIPGPTARHRVRREGLPQGHFAGRRRNRCYLNGRVDIGKIRDTASRVAGMGSAHEQRRSERLRLEPV